MYLYIYVTFVFNMHALCVMFVFIFNASGMANKSIIVYDEVMFIFIM